MRLKVIFGSAVSGAFAALLVVGGAGAQEGKKSAQHSMKAACHVDVLCKGVEPGGGRIIQCLREHKDALSEACLAAIGRQALNSHGKGQSGAEAAPDAGQPAPLDQK